jgi:GT2 family glycosyltransferase
LWHREIFSLIGCWDERWIACYENLDYSLRMFMDEMSAAITHKAVCHHEHGTTYHNGSLAYAYGGSFDHAPLRRLWNEKWPGLDWNMMYDLSQYTDENRQRLWERYRNNIRLYY